MTTYKPAKSPYYAYDFQHKGRRYEASTGCKTKRDADKVEAKARLAAALDEKPAAHCTVDEGFGHWWQNHGQHKRNARSDKYQAAALVAGLGANKRVADVTWKDLDGYVAKRRAKLANGSVNREIGLARRVWRYLARCEFETGKELDWGKLMLPEPKGRIRELHDAEETALFDGLSDDLAAVARFAMLSAQRKAAVITLLWRNVDFANRSAKILLKAEADEWHVFPLTPSMVALLANRPKVGPFVFTYECERPSPKRGDRAARVKGVRYPYSIGGWARKWRTALDAAGIDDFRFHDLRHTALTRVTRAAGLVVANKLAGHTTLQATLRYAHASDGDVMAGMLAAESRNSPGKGLDDAVQAVEKSSVVRLFGSNRG